MATELGGTDWGWEGGGLSGSSVTDILFPFLNAEDKKNIKMQNAEFTFWFNIWLANMDIS